LPNLGRHPGAEYANGDRLNPMEFLSMTRLKNDQYFTPPGLIYPLLKEIQFPANGFYFEPCAGDGAIAKALAEYVDPDNIFTGDIDGDRVVSYDEFDATDSDEWYEVVHDQTLWDWDWVITNPPYKQPDCDRIIQNAWDFAEEGIAMLLRLTYMEPCQNRAKFLKEADLTNLIIFNPRPQFIPGKKATDSSTVAWFVWRKNWPILGTRITYCTDWNE
jgi:hypothetical protein